MSHWRVGRKVGRTLYVDDELVGVMDTRELAAYVVLAVREKQERDAAGATEAAQEGSGVPEPGSETSGPQKGAEDHEHRPDFFDRTICADCDGMHYFCECGKTYGRGERCR